MNSNYLTVLSALRDAGSLNETRPQASALLTVEEVAALLQVPVSWVYDRTRKRSVERIPGFRLGKYWRFREADVMSWIEKQRVGAHPNA
jgi:excisionase family DNA binding protein